MTTETTRRILRPEQRLIVSADFKPPKDEPKKRQWARTQVLNLADDLHGTGIGIKINSALRAIGYDLADEMHNRGLSLCADLKIFDIGETLSTDGIFLKEAAPELLTVVCFAGKAAIVALKAELPNTEVLGVSVLTTFTDGDSVDMFDRSAESAVLHFSGLVADSGLDGLISSAKEVLALRAKFGDRFSFNTPGIRPKWAVVPGDDQKRVMTPTEAIQAGVTRMIIGRPIIQAKNRRDATMQTLDEIISALG